MNINLTNWKFRSFQRKFKRVKGFSENQSLPTNEFFFYSLENFYLSNKHIDIISRYLKWKLKKSGSFQFIYPCDFPLTKKPAEIWMGKGKGEIYDWTMPVKKGLIFFKIWLKNPILINSIFLFIKFKIPVLIKYSYSKHIITQLNSWSFNFNSSKLPIFEANLKKKWFTLEQN